MDTEIEIVIKDLITRVWRTEQEDYANSAERNIREGELTDIYYELDEKIDALIANVAKEYEESINDLEEELNDIRGQIDDLADRNCELKEENTKLKEILKTISEAVNDTWS